MMAFNCIFHLIPLYLCVVRMSVEVRIPRTETQRINQMLFQFLSFCVRYSWVNYGIEYMGVVRCPARLTSCAHLECCFSLCMKSPLDCDCEWVYGPSKRIGLWHKTRHWTNLNSVVDGRLAGWCETREAPFYGSLAYTKYISKKVKRDDKLGRIFFGYWIYVDTAGNRADGHQCLANKMK